MNVHEAIRRRCSVRAYEDRPVEPEKLQRVLDAARLAPTARNMQEFKLVVVQDAAARKALAEAAEQKFIAQAPVVIAAVALDPERTMYCGVRAAPVDCAIAIDHMTLTAVAEGLGTCWIGHFDQDRCRALLGVPPEATIIEMLLLGHSAVEPGPKTRKAIDEIVCNERFA
jgi:nitroreductase